MIFSVFDSGEYRQAIIKAVAALESRLQNTYREQDIRILQAISQILESVDYMECLDVEAGKGEVVVASEVTRVGNQSLQLLDQVSAAAADWGMSDSVLQLQRLSLPVAFWIEQHQGYIESLELIVNAFAGFANQIDDPARLGVLCEAISKVQSVVSIPVRQTSQNGDPMDPWRILNLNWGIVATRTHNTALMEEVFGQLISNIPLDARGFFQEGMQQMDIVGYPDEVRQVMEKYSDLWGSESRLH